jgi:hypothetical protein
VLEIMNPVQREPVRSHRDLMAEQASRINQQVGRRPRSINKQLGQGSQAINRQTGQQTQSINHQIGQQAHQSCGAALA